MAIDRTRRNVHSGPPVFFGGLQESTRSPFGAFGDAAASVGCEVLGLAAELARSLAAQRAAQGLCRVTLVPRTLALDGQLSSWLGSSEMRCF